MPYALGIDLGSGHLTAALCRNDRERWGEPEVLSLDGPTTEAVLHLTDEGTVEVGSRALQHVTTRPDRVTRRFVDRVGDEVPISLGGQPYPAEVLIAAVVGWIADYAEASEGVPATRLVVTHPAGWSNYRRATLLGALREVDLPELTLLPRPVAAAESFAAAERVEVGQEIAVHSLGASRFESAVLRRGSFGFELRGHADSVETMGGDLFDDLLAARVLDELGMEVEPVALAKLRATCRSAKERLSTEVAVTVPAPARSTRGTVMVNRTDLEELIRPAVEVTVAALGRTIQAAGTSTGALRAVVLVGGSGRIPLVSELVSAGVRARVAAAADPELSVARGAALAAARVAKPTVQAPAVKTPALAHRPEPIASSAVTHTDLMSMDDLPEDADVGPPPPRPPVDIAPLEPPKRRLLRLGSRSSRAEDAVPDRDHHRDQHRDQHREERRDEHEPARRRAARVTKRDADERSDYLDERSGYDLEVPGADDLHLAPAPRLRTRTYSDSGAFDLDAGPRSTEFDVESVLGSGPSSGSGPRSLFDDESRPHLADAFRSRRQAGPRESSYADRLRGRGEFDVDAEPADVGWGHRSGDDGGPPQPRGRSGTRPAGQDRPPHPDAYADSGEAWPAQHGGRPPYAEPPPPHDAPSGHHATRASARRPDEPGSGPRSWTEPDAGTPAPRHGLDDGLTQHGGRADPPAGRHGLEPDPADEPWGHRPPDVPASRHSIDDAPARHTTGRHDVDAAPALHDTAPWNPYDAEPEQYTGDTYDEAPAGRHGLDDDVPAGRHGRESWPAPRRRRHVTDDRAFNEGLSRARHAGTDGAEYGATRGGRYGGHHTSYGGDHEGNYEVADEPRPGRDFR